MMDTLPEVLVGAVLDFVPRRSLVEVALGSHSSNQVIVQYATDRLAKSELGKSFVRRHVEGMTAERGNFSPAYLLFCVDAAPKIGAYFSMQGLDTGMQESFNQIMQRVYPNDIYRERFYVGWGRILFLIDGIAVYESIEGCISGRWRFVVSRSPLPQLIQALTPNSVQSWLSDGRVQSQHIMENLWERGWTMYDFQINDNNDEEDDEESLDEESEEEEAVDDEESEEDDMSEGS